MEKTLNDLVAKLQRSLGDRLVSVVLYGSAAGPDYHGAFSDLNVLCVLSAVTPAELGAVEPIFHWFREKGSPSPLLLSREEVLNSTDCFPIEFHDIRDQHRILFGEDLVSGLVINDVFYRAEVEHELRGKLLRLRQKAAGVLSDKELLARLMVDSVSTFCILGRHALRLHGISAGRGKREFVAAAQTAFGIAGAPLLRLLDVREGKAKLRDLDPPRLFADYLQAIETLARAVDRLDDRGRAPQPPEEN
ncbi:MAG: hypothetical protein MUC42_12165 [Bryobacter sp.]|jgi:predicted nucleotidyltransferase|nr:hypothetical protein [Bryobacter sp.]